MKRKPRCEFCKKHPAKYRVYRTVPDPRGPEMGGYMYENARVCKKCYQAVLEDAYAD